MNPKLLFDRWIDRDPATGKPEWKLDTPSHIKAAGAGYKKFLRLTEHRPVEKGAPNDSH